MQEYMQSLHDKSLELASRLTFNRDFRADGTVIMIYGRLIELTSGVVALMEARRTAGIPILFRSFFEAYVDFVNLMDDPDYVNNMQLRTDKQWVRILKDSKESNPYLATIGNDKDLDTVLAEREAEIKRLADAGFKSLNVYDRFDKANLSDEYRAIYAFTSKEAHNDFGALTRHHAELDGKGYRLVFYKALEDGEFDPTLDSIAGLLLDATRRLHGRFASGCDAEIEELDKALNQIRARSE